MVEEATRDCMTSDKLAQGEAIKAYVDDQIFGLAEELI